MNNNLLRKFISNTSSIIDTANQIIPLYEEIKPIFNKLMSFKEKLVNLNINKFLSNKKFNKKEEVKQYLTSSIPQFFQ